MFRLFQGQAGKRSSTWICWDRSIPVDCRMHVIGQSNLSGFHCCSLDGNASCGVLPKRDEKHSHQCRDHDLTDPQTVAGDALLEPTTELALWLMSWLHQASWISAVPTLLYATTTLFVCARAIDVFSQLPQSL
jgi:hypothetical protein